MNQQKSWLPWVCVQAPALLYERMQFTRPFLSFVQAVAEAQTRAQLAGVSANIQFHRASVANLDFLTGLYDLALDVGCMHALDEAELHAYAAGVRRLLRPGAAYLLFVRLRQPDDDFANGPRGLPEESIRRLFASGFVLERVEHGETTVEDHPVWASAWFYFRRQSG